MKEEFEKNGYYVLRSVLTEAEVDQLATPIRAAFKRGDYDTFHKGPAYPAAGIHSMGPRVLENHPEIADVSLAHPAIMEAILKTGFKGVVAQEFIPQNKTNNGFDSLADSIRRCDV